MILCLDIDGTIADNSVRESRIVKPFPTQEDFDIFYSEESVLQDQPIRAALEFFANLKTAVYPIFDTLMFLTGRSESQRAVTVKWLTHHFCLDPHGYLLCMRPDEMKCVEIHLYKETVIKDLIQLPEFKNERFTFIENELNSCKVLSKYGLTLRAPDVWHFLNHSLS
jgi:hypothetical protein